MFNNSIFKLIKIFSFISIALFVFSCKTDETLNFTEISIIDQDETSIEIHIPKVKGETEAAKQINSSLRLFVNTALNIEALDVVNTNTKESIEGFKKAYKDFKMQIGKTLYTNLPPWEVLIDGEVIYKNETLVSIAMNSSINTGGAHSNLVFKFYNFDIITGRELKTKDLINDATAFTLLAKTYYNKELFSAASERIEAFESDTYTLPENLGFSKDGVIVFYDTYNSSSNNVIEFTIPYAVSNKFLNF